MSDAPAPIEADAVRAAPKLAMDREAGMNFDALAVALRLVWHIARAADTRGSAG